MVGSTFILEEMDIKLNTEYIGSNFIFCDELNSTNEYLLNDMTVTQHGTLILAENQFLGRGRLGRKWISEKNMSLTFSILLTENINSDNLNLINLGHSITFIM